MGFIDTHSHIYGPEFLDDIDVVINRAKDCGLDKLLLPNINVGTVRPMLELCQKHPGYLYPMIGLHPEDVNEAYLDSLSYMHDLLFSQAHSFIAIGEVGLDFYWDKKFRAEQIIAFDQQVKWAVESKLPLMIHCRAAHTEMLDVLRRYHDCQLSGVFHCFGGTRDEAEELLSFDGFLLGIGGVLTFKKSSLPDVLLDVPLSRIVIETDSPYLAPVPCRGKRNEPSFAVHVVNRLAEIYGVTPEEVKKQTNANVLRVFKRLNP